MTDNSDVRATQADAQGEKKGGSAGIIVVILIVIIGVILFFSMQKKGPELGKVMEILPQECAMLMQMDLDKAEDKNIREELWNKLKENEEFQKSLKDLETKEQINFEEDVMSWIGNQVTMSFLSMPSDMGKPGMKSQPENIVMVFSVKDMAKAKEKIKKLTGENAKIEKYGETDMIVDTGKKKSVVAFVKGMFVVTDNVDTMKKVIDTAAGKNKTIKDNAALMSAIKKLPPKSVGMMYLDFGPIAEASIAKMNKRSGDKKANEMGEKFLKAIKAMAMGFGFEKGNIVASGFVAMDKNSDSIIVKTLMETKPSLGDPKSLKLYPKDDSYYGATDIKYIYELIMKVAEQRPNGKQQIETGMEQFKTQFDVDIQKDILDNLSGELAYTLDFAQLIQSQMRGRGSKEPPPIVASLLVKDKAKMKAVIDKLTSGKLGQMLSKSDKNGVTVYTVQGGPVAFTLYEDFFILGLGKGVGKIDTILENKMDEGKSLASKDGYKLIKGRINKNTISVGMVQFEKLMPMMEMVKAMGASKNAKGAAAMSTIIDYMHKYGEVWSTSEVTSEGFKFDVIAIKTEKKEDKK